MNNVVTFAILNSKEMTTINLDRVIYSTINKKWYIQIYNKHFIEIEISESVAKQLIEDYELIETNLFRWESM